MRIEEAVARLGVHECRFGEVARRGIEIRRSPSLAVALLAVAARAQGLVVSSAGVLQAAASSGPPGKPEMRGNPLAGKRKTGMMESGTRDRGFWK